MSPAAARAAARAAAGRRGRLLFVAVNLCPPGGGQCVGAWALQALCEEWDVTVLCSEPPDFAGLNRHFGTDLDAAAFRLVQAPWLVRNSYRIDPDPNSFQRAAWLMRKSRQIGAGFDVILGTDNEMDYGFPGIQYVHYPYLVNHRPQVDAVRQLSRAGRLGAFFSGRYRPWMLVSGISFERINSNLTLVNSNWTAGLVERLYPTRPSVLYPPAMWPSSTTPWQQRRLAFVVLGRIERFKRQVEAIDILERVRQRGHPVELEIIGDISDAAYAQVLEERARAAGSWVGLHHGIDRVELESIVGGCRYGLHTMREEHFGIAVAELLRAGCVVFVPQGGGQVEVVGHEPALCYGSDDQAVERICRVLESEQEQSRLQDVLASRAGLFSEQRFMTGMRSLVREFAAAHPR